MKAKLIKLANKLDQLGEYDLANEVDNILKSATDIFDSDQDEDPWTKERRDHAAGVGEVGLAHPANMLQDNLLSLLRKYSDKLEEKKILEVLYDTIEEFKRFNARK